MLTRKSANVTVNGVALSLQFPYKGCSRVKQISWELSQTKTRVQLCWSLLSGPWALTRSRWKVTPREGGDCPSFSVISCDKAAISLIGMIQINHLTQPSTTFRHPSKDPSLLYSCQNNLDISSTNPFRCCSLLFLVTVTLTIFQGLCHSAVWPPSYAGCWQT